MEKSCHSMRLRSRENSRSNACNQRTILGDVTNRRGENVRGQKELASKRCVAKLNPSTNGVSSTAEEIKEFRRGRINATRAQAIAPQISRFSSSQSSSQSLSTTSLDDKSITDVLPTQKSGKRREKCDNNIQVSSRPLKKAKNSILDVAPIRRSTRSNKSWESGQHNEHFEVKEIPIVTDPYYVVPPGFGLRRKSFNGTNFTHGIPHYDAPDKSDPLMCKDYVTDMFQHFFLAESQTRPEVYMHDQDDINAKMRAILVDWLVEVHMKFRLNPGTLFLCVNILDRYCSKINVRRSQLQLVGVTALLVACKHEEIYPPEVRDCVYITDRAYNRQEVLDMEQSIVKELDWRISVPTAFPFLHRFLSLVQASPPACHAAHFYLERSLQEHDMLEFLPSVICAAAVVLAINNPDILRIDELPDCDAPGVPNILLEYTQFDKETIIRVAKLLSTKVANEPITASKRRLVAVKKKFEHAKYLKVSINVALPSMKHLSRGRRNNN